MSEHPPKPRLALTIGITGHRPPPPPTPGAPPAHARAYDAQNIARGIGAFFDQTIAAVGSLSSETRAHYNDSPPLLALVSSLAEGADRIAAKLAHEKGFAVDVALPCDAARYRQTFMTEDARVEFDALLPAARATLVLPLPGASGDDEGRRLNRAFEMAGLTMLARADILLAVWDGQPAQGRGGTGDIVDEAARSGVPIVVVDPKTGDARLLWQADFVEAPLARRAEDIAPQSVPDGLTDVLEWLLAPPDNAEQQVGLNAFFACRLSGSPSAANNSASRESLFVGDVTIEKARKEWPRLAEAMGASATNRDAVARYSEAMRAAENVAGRNAARYRGLFMISSFATLITTSVVAGSAIRAHLHIVAAGVELATVAIVGLAVYCAQLWRWHNQWFEAREVVERLRLASIPWLLGAWPSGLGAGQAGWPGWYARAIAREQPLLAGDLGSILHDARDILWTLVNEQLDYHSRNEERLSRRNYIFEVLGFALLAASVLSNAAFLFAKLAEHPEVERIGPYLLATSIFFPAAATAFYSVRLFGDYEDLAHRSRRTGELLGEVKGRLVGDLDLAAVRGIAAQASRAMLSDLDAWRVAVESRRLSAT